MEAMPTIALRTKTRANALANEEMAYLRSDCWATPSPAYVPIREGGSSLRHENAELIPGEYTRASLLELIDKQGFYGLYDLVYVPIDFQTEINHGYAFINFTSIENAEAFRGHFAGFCDWMVPSDRICEIAWSDALQGIDAHIQRYRDSPMMHESVEDRFRPILFKDGERIPFPAPTRKIRAPRIKRQKIPLETDGVSVVD